MEWREPSAICGWWQTGWSGWYAAIHLDLNMMAKLDNRYLMMYCKSKLKVLYQRLNNPEHESSLVINWIDEFCRKGLLVLKLNIRSNHAPLVKATTGILGCISKSRVSVSSLSSSLVSPRLEHTVFSSSEEKTGGKSCYLQLLTGRVRRSWIQALLGGVRWEEKRQQTQVATWRFWLNTKMHFSAMRAIRHWNRLAGEVLKSPSSETMN